MLNLFVIFLVDQGDVALSTYEASLVPVLFPLGKKVMIRGKIFAKGSCKWHGIFLGAPALECAP